MSSSQIERDEIVQRLLDAQAELQTGLGMFRLKFNEYEWPASSPPIEGYLARSLKMQQHLLAKLGHQMYDGPAADDPDVERHA